MTKYALVTGAGRGVGLQILHGLVESGYKVFAGVRNDRHAEDIRVRFGSHATPLMMDVTDRDQIGTVAERIADRIGADGALDALVSNAGVNMNAPIHRLEPGEIRIMVEANLLGPMFLCNAMRPLLKPGRSRVVFVTSATALMPPPTISVYGATKCGVEGMADALRLEFGMSDIGVSIVQPGVIETKMTADGPEILNRMLSRMSDEERAMYQPLMQKIVDMSRKGVSAETVAKAVVKALTARKPRRIYHVGIDCKIASLFSPFPRGFKDFIQRKTFGI